MIPECKQIEGDKGTGMLLRFEGATWSRSFSHRMPSQFSFHPTSRVPAMNLFLILPTSVNIENRIGLGQDIRIQVFGAIARCDLFMVFGSRDYGEQNACPANNAEELKAWMEKLSKLKKHKRERRRPLLINMLRQEE